MVLAITGAFRFTFNDYISIQQPNFCSHINAIYNFTHVKIMRFACQNIYLVTSEANLKRPTF